MAIDHEDRVFLGGESGSAEPPYDGHYSLHADEADQFQLEHGPEAVPPHLDPSAITLELPEEPAS